MPIYEYACHECGRKFEMLVRSDTVPACPNCQSKDLEKMLSVFATADAAAQAAPASAPACGACCMPGGTCGFN
ncbi:MAG: zinc ribbon domain-containing protein [Rubrivivax sp.]|nr:zinc ribbon domain-containing protein [Rubrivivax sp.]